MLLYLLLGCDTDGPGRDSGRDSPGDSSGDTGGDTAADSGGTPDPVTTWAIPGAQRAPRVHAQAAPDVDVLIVGAGAAGLAAANEALRLGATVLILEREESVGGAAMWASALMLYCGTAQQERMGIADSPTQLLEEWPSFTGGDVADPWVEYFAANNVAEVYDWLGARGVIFLDPRPDPSAGTTPRIHEVIGGGPALIAALEAGVPVEDVRLSAEAVDLALEDGRVTGVVWTDLATGASTTTTAGVVVLATGGFMHDLDRVRVERPDLAAIDMLYDSWPGDDGNGLLLLEGYGAAVQNLGAIGLYAHSIGDPDGSGIGLPIPYVSGAMWVNSAGERFADESQSNSFIVGQALADQPGGMAWIFSDADTSTVLPFGSPDHGNVYTMTGLLDLGAVLVGDDLSGLAGQVGLDGAGLVAHADSFTLFAAGGGPDEQRTDPALADALDHHPYYLVQMQVAAAKGFGGVDVDLAGRVLTTDGEVLPGAYAAGELSGMAGGSLVGDYGFTGSLSAVVLSGRVAGAAAANEALSR